MTKVFIINLDRAKKQWTAITKSAAFHKINVQRVAGVDGTQIPRDEWRNVDKKHSDFNMGEE